MSNQTQKIIIIIQMDIQILLLGETPSSLWAQYVFLKNSITGRNYEQLEKSCHFIGQKVWEPCTNNFIIVGFAY